MQKVVEVGHDCGAEHLIDVIAHARQLKIATHDEKGDPKNKRTLCEAIAKELHIREQARVESQYLVKEFDKELTTEQWAKEKQPKEKRAQEPAAHASTSTAATSSTAAAAAADDTPSMLTAPKRAKRLADEKEEPLVKRRKASTNEKQPATPEEWQQYLFSQIEKGDNANDVSQALDHGVSMEARNVDGKTPLIVAALGLRSQIVDLLLRSGANVNGVDNDGLTPLKRIVAALKDGTANNAKKIIELLLSVGASLTSDLIESIIKVYPIMSKQLNIIKRQQERAAQMQRKKDFFQAVRNGDVQTVDKMLDEYYTRVDEIDFDMKTPLLVAVINNKPNMVDLLLKRGAQVDKAGYADSTTPLIAAIKSVPIGATALRQTIEIISALLDHGAHIDNYIVGDTEKNGNVEIVNILKHAQKTRAARAEERRPYGHDARGRQESARGQAQRPLDKCTRCKNRLITMGLWTWSVDHELSDEDRKALKKQLNDWLRKNAVDKQPGLEAPLDPRYADITQAKPVDPRYAEATEAQAFVGECRRYFIDKDC